jgi:hypothetical protein
MMNIGNTVYNEIHVMDMEVNNELWIRINLTVAFTIRHITWDDNLKCSTYFSSNDMIL